MAVVVAAVAGGAYLVAGEAALAYIAYAGMATTVVGMLTKDKNLTELGGKMALVGGVGSLAAGALSSSAAGTSQADMLAAQNAPMTGEITNAASTGAAVDAASSGATTGQADMLTSQTGAFGNDGAKATFDAASTPTGMPAANTFTPTAADGSPLSSSGTQLNTPPMTGGQMPDANAYMQAANNAADPASQAYYKSLASGASPDQAQVAFNSLGGSGLFSGPLNAKQYLYTQMGMGAISGINQSDIAEKNRAVQEQTNSINQQSVSQRSHGSDNTYYGIINKAKAKG